MVTTGAIDRPAVPLLPTELAEFLSAGHGSCLDLASSNVDGRQSEPSFGGHTNLAKHLTMLKQEFAGKPALLFYHAAIIVLIRREIDLRDNVSRFIRMWEEASQYLCHELDSRWLVSACDTMADHWPEQTERALALAGSLFMNTVKLYETERVASKGTKELGNLPEGRVPLHDGLTAFSIGRGNMIANLHQRVKAVANTGGPASTILLELLRRANEHDTVYRRFRDLHLDPETLW